MGNEITIVAFISSILILSGLVLGFAMLKVQGE
uniref:Cytochrome b6-f complex subunit 7 n=1 Tax=Calliarthron tuberculosum TaxID=48942 RepID=M4ITU9_CALTB|nr:cytochrome b6-f complex subunit VII [Calliarthron tuberculosum]AGA63856.1 cytochrome b6-f complex subunit VII [Calliarthron tuberculosum]